MASVLDAIERFSSSTFGLPPSMPLIDSTGRAIYAMYPDDRTLAYVETLGADARMTARIRVSAWISEREAVADARALLEKTQWSATREDVLRAMCTSARIDRRRAATLFSYMLKNGETVERVGQQSQPDEGALARAQMQTPPAGFRMGRLAVQPVVVNISALQSSPVVGTNGAERNVERLARSHELSRRAVLERGSAPTYLGRPDAPFQGVTVPASERIPVKATTVRLRSLTWLLWQRRESAASPNRARAHVVGLDGELTKIISLHHDVVRHFAMPHRDSVAILDSDLVLHVYDQSGRVLFETALAGTPEVTAAFGAWNQDSHPLKIQAALRGIDFDPDRRILLITLLEFVWVFSADGTVLFAKRVQAAASRSLQLGTLDERMAAAVAVLGLPPDSSHDDIAESIEMAGHRLTTDDISLTAIIEPIEDRLTNALETMASARQDDARDWIYGAWLTPDGGCIVSAYSGKTLELDACGVELRAWYARGPQLEAVRLTDCWFTASFGVPSILMEAGVAQTLSAEDRTKWHATRTPEVLSVHKANMLPPLQVVLPATFVAFYPAGEGLVIETKTKRFRIELAQNG
ncbi:hypothetical protein PA27867_2068 [Cryobacterium arcticum]|uniref:Uncharacterized protein n=2 Tax=Cryobacterium arcticum TaxID=670052 RepID=A0A1B1BKA8_9MICO|nr:hypothetical protein PA27867_2068 [Cryobacterium arcticum]